MHRVPTLLQLLEGADRLPLPGAGGTRERWRRLARVAAIDLSLVKLFEGHMDAIAIQAELGAPAPPDRSRWGTWCAEPRDARVSAVARDDRAVRLHGMKAWCSGAEAVTHAIVSCWNAQDEPCLAAVALEQESVSIVDSGWNAVGMHDTRTRDVHFDGAAAIWVSDPHAYVQRLGFWQGSAGIAACWWGGAAAIGTLATQYAARTTDAHVLAHLGAIDVALENAASLLRASADWIDAHPAADAKTLALRARLAVEHAAAEVMWRAGRVVGAGPLCRDERLAKAMADLPVFLRQSHAERDLASLGSHLLEAIPSNEPWTL